MASSSGSGPAQVDELKERLYNICADGDAHRVFRQEDLMDFGVIPNSDAGLLLRVTQKLCDEKLFKMVRDGSNIGWMYRSREDAKKYDPFVQDKPVIADLSIDIGD